MATMAPSPACRALSSLLLALFLSVSATSDTNHESFIKCFSTHTPPSTNLNSLLHTPDSVDFSSLLNSSIKNLLFAAPATPRPSLIILPSDYSHVQASVICCRAHGLTIRVRSGGHDYEGLSYRSVDPSDPFALLDLSGLRSIDIDLDRSVATVHAGATVGELYYRIAQKSNTHGFPAGICPTVAVGGHISGGGFGTMLRKYGLASDNVIDAQLVDADGRLLDRASMGEDLFWAIRGGGAASFGVILSWKLSLVPVPDTVTVFSVSRTHSQGAIHLTNRWQEVAHRLVTSLFIRIVIETQTDEAGGKETVALFNSLFLGTSGELLTLMAAEFPELGLQSADCIEMSWAQSTMYFAGYTHGETMEALLDRGSSPERFFRAKSDFVNVPISESVLESLWGRFAEDGAGVMIMDPYGGEMGRINETETPFPHRRGVLYNIQYFVEWRDGGEDEARKRTGWIGRLYGDMGRYVSKEPRCAYLNYRDLGLGRNGKTSSYEEAEVWGVKYFKGNFERLARVKGRVDPADFFRNEQSVPPLAAEEGASGSEIRGETVSITCCRRRSEWFGDEWRETVRGVSRIVLSSLRSEWFGDEWRDCPRSS